METRTMVAIAAVAAVAVIAAAFVVLGDSDGKVDNMPVIDTDNTDVVNVKVGEEFTISREGNATTGYQWALVSSDGLKPIKDWYEAKNDGHLMGAGGHHYFTFVAEKEGTYEVVLDYLRSWQGSEGNTVTIKIVAQ